MNTTNDSEGTSARLAAGDASRAPDCSADAPSNVADDAEFESLDSRWMGLARSVNALTFLVLGLVVVPLGAGLLLALPGAWKLVVPLVWALLAGACVLSVFWWPRWEYDRWSYRVGSQVLELRSGVIWHSLVAIPLSRLQHVDLHRGPLERRWNLASLQIHTAGTRDASHTLPGLDVVTASELRDRLIDAANRGSLGQDQDGSET